MIRRLEQFEVERVKRNRNDFWVARLKLEEMLLRRPGGFFGAIPAATLFGAPAALPTQSCFELERQLPSRGQVFSEDVIRSERLQHRYSVQRRRTFGTKFPQGPRPALECSTEPTRFADMFKTAFGNTTTSLLRQTNQAQLSGGLLSGGAANTEKKTSAYGGLGAQTTPNKNTNTVTRDIIFDTRPSRGK